VLFIPAAGRYYEGVLYRATEQSNLWSATPNGNTDVYYMDGTSSNIVVPGLGDRSCGFSIRPVIG
jgi:hypothetical protein